METDQTPGPPAYFLAADDTLPLASGRNGEMDRLREETLNAELAVGILALKRLASARVPQSHPLFPELTADEQAWVVESIADFYS